LAANNAIISQNFAQKNARLKFTKAKQDNRILRPRSEDGVDTKRKAIVIVAKWLVIIGLSDVLIALPNQHPDLSEEDQEPAIRIKADHEILSDFEQVEDHEDERVTEGENVQKSSNSKSSPQSPSKVTM